jgi:hypothetical protein
MLTTRPPKPPGRSVEIKLDQVKTRSVKFGRGVFMGVVCRRLHSTGIVNTLPRKFSKALETPE